MFPKILKYFIGIIFLMVLFSCDSVEPNSLKDNSTILVQNLVEDNWPNDLFTINSAYIDSNDSLVASVSYSGGCKEHIIALIISTGFEKSLPVQTKAMISHEGNDDMCEAYVTKTLKFSLLPLRDYYVKRYGGNASIIIHLNNYQTPILFSF